MTEGINYPGQIEFIDEGGWTIYRPICGVDFCQWKGKPLHCSTDPREQVEKSDAALAALKRHFWQFHKTRLERQGINIEAIR